MKNLRLSKTGLIIAVIVVIAVLLLALGIFSLAKSSGDAQTADASATPGATAINYSLGQPDDKTGEMKPMPSDMRPTPASDQDKQHVALSLAQSFMNTAPFMLTDAQTQLYDTYKSSGYDVKTFKDADPISIVKVSIYCNNVDDVHGRFNLFAPSTLYEIANGKKHKVTFDYFKYLDDMALQQDLLTSRAVTASYNYSGIDQGTFNDNGDNTGMVTCDYSGGTQTIPMVKENGIWMMDYRQ